MKEFLSKASQKFKSIMSTGKGKVVASVSTAAVAVVIVGVVLVCTMGASNGSLPVHMVPSGSPSSSSESDTFAAAPAVSSPATTGTGSSSVTSSSTSIAVSSITLDKSSLTLHVGQAAQLSYKILPGNASDISVSWDSSNRSVADINTNCTVTAKSAGTATIKVTASDGKNATCNVTVTAASGSAASTATASKSVDSTPTQKASTPAPAPKPKASATNAAGISSYASYGFSHGVSVNNAQVLTENWNFDQMVSDVTKGIELGDTVNYASTNLGNYKTQMYYYWASESFTNNWINQVKQYNIDETCEFQTNKNEIYQDANGNMIIRGEKIIHIISASSGYFNSIAQYGISSPGTYSRIVDVIVATGAQSNQHPESMYSIGGSYTLENWNRT